MQDVTIDGRYTTPVFISPPHPGSLRLLLLSVSRDKLSVEYQFQKKITQFWLSNQFHPLRSNTKTSAWTRTNKQTHTHTLTEMQHDARGTCSMAALPNQTQCTTN